MKFFLTLIFLLAQPGITSDIKTNKSSKTAVLQSGRDYDILDINKEAVNLVDQALDKLGISRPPHLLEFVPSNQLAHLAVLGRPAIGHWYDGSIVATQARHSMGVMEFVTPGDSTCRSFYSDSTSHEHQIEIFKHVGGHNDMAVNSIYSRARPHMDPIAAAEALYNFFEAAYREYDTDEVAQWYQYLMTLSSAQDLARGSYLPPENFIRDPNEYKKPQQGFQGILKLGQKSAEIIPQIHPKAPTPHELQFTIHNLPEELPPWKKEMARLYERVERIMGYYTSTKIINEGWATFVQELLVPYLPWTDSFNLIEAAELKTGVAVPKISNPYWLGREAWRNLYRKFHKDAKLDMALLDIEKRLEQDRKFVKYAHGIMAEMGDYGFLRLALNDQQWVGENHLYLYRKAKNSEWDQDLVKPRSKKPLEQKVVVSIQPQEVADYIATKLADRTLQYPTIFLENMAASSKNIFSLVHEPVADIPLKRSSAVQAMFIRSQIWQRTVSLKTIALSSWGKKRPKLNWWEKRQETLSMISIRIEVDPDGKVRVYNKDELNPELTAHYQKLLEQFIEELDGSVYEALEESQKQRYAPILATIKNNYTKASMNLLSHSPTAATAIIRYHEMIDRRLYASIRRAILGKAPLKRTQNGARIRVLPIIPEFELDKAAAKRLEKSRETEIVLQTKKIVRPAQGLFALLSNNVLVATQVQAQERSLGGGDSSTPSEGDKVWGPADNDDGQGDGDDDDDGDSDQQSPKKPGQGDDDQDSAEIDIPLDLLGEFLKEEIELPNLKPKLGISIHKDTERDSAKKRNHGEILWDRVVPLAIVYGEMDFIKRGQVAPNRKEIMREGMKYIQPSDWYVPDRQEIPAPDMNAVIAIWMDMTGSMMGKPIEMAKQFMFNLKALLSTKYKNITFKYIGFADTARVYETEEKFFKGFINGGTNYAVGIKKTREVLKEFNPTQWDRYAFGIGDAEDGNPTESILELNNLTKETEYSAFVQTYIENQNWPNANFMKAIQTLADDEKAFFGFGQLKPSRTGALEALRQILGKNRNKK